MGIELQAAVVGSSPDSATCLLQVLDSFSPLLGLSLLKYMMEEVGSQHCTDSNSLWSGGSSKIAPDPFLLFNSQW